MINTKVTLTKDPIMGVGQGADATALCSELRTALEWQWRVCRNQDPDDFAAEDSVDAGRKVSRILEVIERALQSETNDGVDRPKDSSTMRVEIQRNETSQPIVYAAINAYTKGPMYCVLFAKDGKRVTHKFPLCSLFRVIEDYMESKQ